MSDESSNPSCSYRANEGWDTIDINLVALHKIVCEVFRLPLSQCGPPVLVGREEQANYARVYSFQLPTRKIVARLVYPAKPLFKTESEVAAMDFVRSRTSLPVPKVFAYCSEASNPVGVEWLIMEHMPGIEMGKAWRNLGFSQKKKLALDIIDLFDQLFRLKADGCGGIYHSVSCVDDSSHYQRSPRWTPLSSKSISLLKTQCSHSLHDIYTLGPLNNVSLVDHRYPAPSPSATLPVFSSDDYVKLLAFHGNPSTRSEYDNPSHEKCVQLFQSVHNLYPNSTVFGPSADSVNFRFSHGDLHDWNILIDPDSGSITAILDWENAAFRPLWSEIRGVGWFQEDAQRFLFGSSDPGNFAHDTGSQDAELRAFFRTEMVKRNPDLFSSFLGAIELRAVLHAAADVPRPIGETNIFLVFYYKLGYWNEDRRGPFPWDMPAWRLRRLQLDKLIMEAGA